MSNGKQNMRLSAAIYRMKLQVIKNVLFLR